MKKKNEKFVEGCGNVFADLGLPDADELLAKAQLVFRIHAIIRSKKLTQKKAALILGIDQPKVSALIRGHLDGFSTERLFRFLNALGEDVEIVLRPKKRTAKKAGVRVLGYRNSVRA